MITKKLLLIFTFLLSTGNSFACECECIGDCTFKNVSRGTDFVALVKVVEYSDYLDDEILGYEGKMPLSMTVEIIKKYKGSESKEKIKIWGDNGVLCRPYTAYFEIGKYYLIAPTKITEPNENESKTDYEFFACFVDYLEVDYEKTIAHGDYTKRTKKITLEKFEKNLKK